MWFILDQVGLDYVHAAPRRVRQEIVLDADPAAVFNVLTGDRWNEWFPDIKEIRWGPPRGVGGTRYVHLGHSRACETLRAWEPARRIALSLDRSNLPVVKALLVDFQLSPLADGRRTRLQLAWHYELRLWLRPVHTRVRQRFQEIVDGALAGFKTFVER